MEATRGVLLHAATQQDWDAARDVFRKRGPIGFGLEHSGNNVLYCVRFTLGRLITAAALIRSARIALKWTVACEQLVQHAAERPYVGAAVHLFAASLFR
jgi:hypothetical protein